MSTHMKAYIDGIGLEKVEIVQAVGAEALAAQALMHVMRGEIDRL